MNAEGSAQEELRRYSEWPSAFVDQLKTFTSWIRGNIDAVEPRYEDHFNHVALIEAAYLLTKDVNPFLLQHYYNLITLKPHE